MLEKASPSIGHLFLKPFFIIPGIMTRYGYWLNLDTLEWTPLAPLVYNPIGDQANGMNSFQGRPTIFGNPECNDGGECPETGVVQVMTKTDLVWDLKFASTDPPIPVQPRGEFLGPDWKPGYSQEGHHSGGGREEKWEKYDLFK